MKIFFTVIAFLVSLQAISQDKLGDLKRQISLSKKVDTNYLKLTLELSGYYLGSQTDSALKYAIISSRLSNRFSNQQLKISALEILGRARYNKGLIPDALAAFKEQEKISTSKSQKANSIRNQGNIYIELGKPNEAIDAYKRAIEYAEAASDLKLAAICRSNISYVLRQQGRYEEAYEQQLSALKFAEKINYEPLIAQAQNQLALMQYSRRQWDEAQTHAKQALTVYKRLKNNPGKAVSFTILGGVASEKQSYDAAKNYISEAYRINKSLNDARQIANSAADLAQINLSLGNYKDAMEKINEALPLHEKSQAINNLSSSFTTRGKIRIAIKDYADAETDIQKALNLARGGFFKESEKKALEALALLKFAQGDFNGAYQAQLKLNVLKDSMFNAENSSQINDLKTAYETEKKEQQISLLNSKNELQKLNLFNQELELAKRALAISNKDLEIDNQNFKIKQKENDIRQKSLEAVQQRQKITSLNQQSVIQKLEIERKNIFLIVSAVVLAFVLSTGYFVYNRRKLKARAQLQEEINKQQDMAARAVLDAEERERRRIAGDLHDGVGQLLSAALMNLNGLFQKLGLSGDAGIKAEQSLALVNESYDEMRNISHQMMPNALLKAGLASAVKEFLNKIDKDKIKINLETIGLGERLDEQTETVLYRVIQEAVNNVIKHSGANKLSLQLIRDNDGVTVTVEDNGKGFDTSKTDLKSGIGMSNIYSRIGFLKGTVDIDTAPDKGTLVNIFVPA